jgi:peptidoglycan/LPS O-acetylase OafA/YrhL
MFDGVRITHDNCFGFLRLLFASLVIAGHSPEFVDGNNAREILTMMFHTMSFGGLAVDGFFIISGFLVTESYMASRSTSSFLAKRVIRIYPGFCVACLVCIFIFAPMAGAEQHHFAPAWWVVQIEQTLTLNGPVIKGALPGLHLPFLTGAMWTIKFEFICYLLVAASGALGLLQKRRILLFVSIVLVTARVISVFYAWQPPMPPYNNGIFGVYNDPNSLLNFVSVFSVGMCFRLYADKIRLTKYGLAVSALAFLVLMRIPFLAELGVMTFGAYIIFFVAFSVQSKWLRRINSRYDISYGIYLYGSSVALLFIFYDRHINPAILCIITLAVAVVFGFISWHLVEKPFLSLKKGRGMRLVPKMA